MIYSFAIICYNTHMKKILLNTLAGLLILYHGYLIITYVPQLLATYSEYDAKALLYSILFTFAVTLLVIVGVSLYFRKNWSIVLYWISISVLLVLTVAGAIELPFINNYLFIFLNAIVAIFLSTQWGKLKK